MAFHGKLVEKVKKAGRDAKAAVIKFATEKSGIVPGTASLGKGVQQIPLSDADVAAKKTAAAEAANKPNESGDAGDPQKKEFNKEQERQRRRRQSVAGGGVPVNKRGN